MAQVAINVNGNGVNTIIAAVAGRSIVVQGYALMAGNTVSANWQDTAGTALSGPFPFVANSGVAPSAPQSFVVGQGLGLNLNLTGPVAVAGHLNYILV